MKNKKENIAEYNAGKPKSKFWGACGKDDLRPSFSFVKIMDGKLWATDAHLLLVQDANLHWGENVVKNLEGKYLHMETLAKMNLEKNLHYIHGEGFLAPCSSLGEKGGRMYYYHEEISAEFPKVKSVIKPTLTDVTIEAISVNLTLLNRVKNLFVWPLKGVTQVRIYRHGKKKNEDSVSPLIIIPTSESLENPRQYCIFMQAHDYELTNLKLQS